MIYFYLGILMPGTQNDRSLGKGKKMNKNIDLIVANASGNITIMVLTPTSRKDYKETARQLLQQKELGGEQVAFLLPEKTPSQSKKIPSQTGSLAEIPSAPLPQMEMCGLEFCGNASRAFARYLADTKKQDTVTIRTSGCEKPLTARIFPDGTVEMEMPVPSGIQLIPAKELSIQKDGILVKMDGIAHLILEDIAPTIERFETIKNHIYKAISPDLPAFGIMFCDTANQCMTPVVYVKDVDTTYFEGSCASGTVAASFALAKNKPDGIHTFTMQQPKGVLHTTVTKKEGRIENISLKGLITYSDVIHITLL